MLTCTTLQYKIIDYSISVENGNSLLKMNGQRKCTTESNTFLNAEIIGVDISLTTLLTNLDIIIKCQPSAFPLMSVYNMNNGVPYSTRYHNIDYTKDSENYVPFIVQQTPEILKCGVNSSSGTQS